jgi:hypothetical protein
MGIDLFQKFLGKNGTLFVLRCPLYISIILISIYQKLDLSVSEKVKVLSLIATYIIDNFLFPYKMIK